MKTKLIILSAVVLTVISCSSDRDEDARTDERVKNSNQKLKLNKLNALPADNTFNATSKNDSIIIRSGNSVTEGEGLDPIDGGDPKNLPPRK